MGRAGRALAAAVLALLPRLAPAADVRGFDGPWQTTLSCPGFRDALGYSFQFTSLVRNGVLHGAHGAQGEPGSLQVDGPIGPDGAARLYARGQTGSREFVPGRDTPRGTDYGFTIDARFAGSEGSGTRVEGRPCSFRFTRMPD